MRLFTFASVTVDTLCRLAVELESPLDRGRPVVVCVNNDLAELRALEEVLSMRFVALAAATHGEAIKLVESHADVACVLADLQNTSAAAALLAQVAQLRPHCRRAVLATNSEWQDLISAINSGQLHYVITKPWTTQSLTEIVDGLVQTFQLELETQRALGELKVVNQQLVTQGRALEVQLDARSREVTAAAERLAQMGHQLDRMALRDGLTGLYSHLAFQERLRDAVGRALRFGEPVALVLADIDGFASINYELGYQCGDDILRRVAMLLQSETPDRSTEVVARFSGEEFALLLPDTSKSAALARAARLRDAIAVAEMPGGRQLSLSFGVACLPEDAADPEGLLTAAEAALRGAKRGGPGRVQFFAASDNGRSRTSVSRTFGRAPDLDRFRHYQERMNEVTAILVRERALSCLLVDLSRLHRVELDLGVSYHSEIYDQAAIVLDKLRGTLLTRDDLICRSGDGDGYLVILAPRSGNRVDLEALALSVERSVEEALAPTVADLLREQPRITVGSARVLGNSLLRPERIMARLVADAVDNARNLRERKAHRHRTTLQDIILGDGISSVYQPIVDLGTGDIFAYEALTRGPRGTALESPATLFAIADEVDLTVELDRACFRGALQGAKALEPVHRLFVNLLPMSFYDSAFIEEEVGNLLAAAGLTPANIVFEITERLAIENFASFKRALATYTAMGFGVAIDDVGTRHSNLETLMSLRPHFIKISDVLVRGMARSTVKREMLRSLRHIADTIDAVMVAEGIEHLEDVIALRDLGLRYGQGYYMAQPGPSFPILTDEVRAELRAVTPSIRIPTVVPEDDEDEERELAIPLAASSQPAIPVFRTGPGDAVPRNAFGRAEDEITNDFATPEEARGRPRGSEPPGSPLPWRPLSDDDAAQASPEAEPLLSSLQRRTTDESAPGGPRGPRRGLN
jgi:diguanylate cyclase (GGDEF)-like protein